LAAVALGGRTAHDRARSAERKKKGFNGMALPIRRLAIATIVAATLGLVAPAWADEHVVLYSANDDTVNTMLADAFTKQTGIKVDIVSTGSGVLFRRIASEKDNPQADVIWGVSSSLLNQNKAYFQPYAAKDKEAVPAAYRDPDDYWLGTNLQILTISQNTKAIPAAEGPRSWQDLLDAKWKSKIAYTDPGNSGSSYVTATFLLSLWGADEAAWSKLGALLANTKVLNRSTLVFDGNGSGEYPLGISLEYAGDLWAHNGAPVEVIYPSDGTVALAEGIAIIKGGPDQQAARAFVDFVNRKDMQEMMLRATFRRPARQDIDLTTMPGHMPPLAALKLHPYDDVKWEAARRETLTRLKTLIQNTR
jgi:iron(III) transport system substrate-binding protein